jgi:hypothetical protein
MFPVLLHIIWLNSCNNPTRQALLGASLHERGKHLTEVHATKEGKAGFEYKLLSLSFKDRLKSPMFRTIWQLLKYNFAISSGSHAPKYLPK